VTVARPGTSAGEVRDDSPVLAFDGKVTNRHFCSARPTLKMPFQDGSPLARSSQSAGIPAQAKPMSRAGASHGCSGSVQRIERLDSLPIFARQRLAWVTKSGVSRGQGTQDPMVVARMMQRPGKRFPSSKSKWTGVYPQDREALRTKDAPGGWTP
jgi:hypothetical protein